MSLRVAYLFLYNLLQTAGWSYVLVTVLSSGELPRVPKKVSSALYFFQILGCLEILHAFFGLVRASVSVTLIQLFSRVHVLLFHYYCPRDTHTSTGMGPMLVAWGITECVRYAYLGLNLFSLAPSFLKQLRYTLFLVLYPLGVYGEMKVLYDALPQIRDDKTFMKTMPNSFNFAFDTAAYLQFILYVVYIPGLYKQYTHMLVQRKKQLRDTKTSMKFKTQ